MRGGEKYVVKNPRVYDIIQKIIGQKFNAVRMRERL
jgi:hypothetical protein